jgi:hypothetical protein
MNKESKPFIIFILTINFVIPAILITLPIPTPVNIWFFYFFCINPFGILYIVPLITAAYWLTMKIKTARSLKR